MPEIENTALTPRPEWLGGANPRAIESQEAEGQQQFVKSTLFPAKTDEPRADYEALGFVFGEAVDNDPLFVHVQLPEGWTKRATDHDMWSEIVDAEGKVRVNVFYKAAFYDRRAFARFERNAE